MATLRVAMCSGLCAPRTSRGSLRAPAAVRARPLRCRASAQELLSSTPAAPAVEDATSAVLAIQRRDASMHAVLSSLTAAVEGLSQSLEEQQRFTAKSLAALEAKVCAPSPVPSDPSTDHAEVCSLREGNAALQAALETASRLMASVLEEAAEARRARAVEAEEMDTQLREAHAACAKLTEEKARLEAALSDTLGVAVTAQCTVDPPVLAPPALPFPGADTSVSTDLAAALAAARARAKAAEVSLAAARVSAQELVANATR